MSAPAVIYIILSAIGFGMICAKNGQPKTGTHSGWTTLFSSAVIYGLLYWGGFFAVQP